MPHEFNTFDIIKFTHLSTLQIKNITERLYQNEMKNPHEVVLVTEEGNTYTNFDVIYQINCYRKIFSELDLKEGDRVLCLIPFGIELIFTLFALFSNNITPVLIDPRLKKNLWKDSLESSNTKFIISTSRILRLRWIYLWMNQFRLISIDKKISVFVNNLNFLPVQNPPYKTKLNQNILLTLTSGSTSYPKLIFRNFQTMIHQQTYSIQYLPKITMDYHLSLYGLATMIDLIRGAKSFLIKNHDPINILNQVKSQNITRLSLPPGALDRFCQYLEKNDLKVQSIQSILTGGAPIPRWLTLKSKKLFPLAKITIVYGSTECEPISFKTLDDDYFDQKDYGYNVGKPIAEITLIKRHYYYWNNINFFEVELQGKNCVPNSSNESLCTGDIAYQNHNGELILIGRKSDQGGFYILGYLEEHLERIHGIRRIACLPQRNGGIFIYIELDRKIVYCKKKISDQINSIILEKPYNLKFILIKKFFVKSMPIDARHYWKIQRQKLISHSE